MSCWNAELGCGNLKQCVTGLFGPADFVILKHSLSVSGPFWHTSEKAKCANNTDHTEYWTSRHCVKRCSVRIL